MATSKRTGEFKGWLFTRPCRWSETDPFHGGPSAATKIVFRYGFALLLVLAALGLSYGLDPLVGASSLFVLYVMASVIAAWYGGLGPGIFALVAGLLAADFLFVEPLYTFGVDSAKAIALLGVHLCAAVIGLAAIFNLHRARFREKQIEFLAAKLETEVHEHRAALDELRVAKTQLDDHARHLELRVAERTASLVETVKSLEGVLYHVAHDLRSPLRALSGFTQLLGDSLGPKIEGDDRYCLERIVNSAQRMDHLILDLLAYGRLGHVRLNVGPTDLQKLLTKVLHECRDEIEEKHASVEVIPPMPAVVQTDELLLERAMTELVCNALTFTAPGVPPRIRIWTGTIGSRVRLWVEDNGIGIEPAYQERIFRVFERLYPQEGESKTGIGLAMVAKILARLGGSTGVESIIGKGSRFWLELPLSFENH